jgi:MFS family permease
MATTLPSDPLGQGWSGFDLGPLSVAPFLLMAVIVGVCGLGTGLVMPASNNALLDLVPERAGVISAMRGMCRSTGGIIGTALIVVTLELSADKAAGLRAVFVAYGLLLLVTIPLTFLIPDMPRASRRGGVPAARAATPAESDASPGGTPQTVGAGGRTDR